MRKKNFFAALRTEGDSVVLMVPDEIARQVEVISEYSNSINKVHRIMARVLRGWGKPVIEKQITNPKALTDIAAEPSGGEIEKARSLLLVYAMTLTEQALADGRLDSLLPVWQGRVLVTTGRLGDRNMMRLFGVKSLPILMSNSRVAYLYMYLAHQSECGLSNTPVEHHRSAVGTLARSRTYVWVVKGKQLAKKIVN